MGIHHLIILAGIGFLAAALHQSRKINAYIPEVLRWRWLVMEGLMAFFLLGYVVELFAKGRMGPVLAEFLVSSVYLGGAVFVFMIMRVSRLTAVESLSTRETVIALTPANRATSRIFATNRLGLWSGATEQNSGTAVGGTSVTGRSGGGRRTGPLAGQSRNSSGANWYRLLRQVSHSCAVPGDS